MKKAEKELLIGVLGKTVNMPAEKVESLFVQADEKSDEFEFAPDADKIILNADADRVKVFKENGKKEFHDGYKKAKSETLTDFEKQVSEKFGVKTDKIGLELIDEIIASKSKAPELEIDKVKTHPAYLALEKDLNKKVSDTEAIWKKKIEDRESELEAEKIFSDVSAKSREHLKALKPILPSDEAKAKKQLSLLDGELKKYKFAKNGEDIIISDAEGKRLEDEHGKPVSFESLVKKHASDYWDFESGEGRAGSGASNDKLPGAAAGADGKLKWTGKVPKNDEEFSEEFNKIDPSNPKAGEQRAALIDAFETQNQAK